MKQKKSRIQELVKEFPDLFPQNFGIECESGWCELVRLVCKYFQMHLEAHQEIESIKFSQIKEKFGFLRIYFDLSFHDKGNKDNEEFNRIHDFIYTIENVSGLVCEDCGKIKNKNFNVETRVPRSMWKRTMCDKCFEKDRLAFKKQ